MSGTQLEIVLVDQSPPASQQAVPDSGPPASQAPTPNVGVKAPTESNENKPARDEVPNSATPEKNPERVLPSSRSEQPGPKSSPEKTNEPKATDRDKHNVASGVAAAADAVGLGQVARSVLSVIDTAKTVSQGVESLAKLLGKKQPQDGIPIESKSDDSKPDVDGVPTHFKQSDDSTPKDEGIDQPSEKFDDTLASALDKIERNTDPDHLKQAAKQIVDGLRDGKKQDDSGHSDGPSSAPSAASDSVPTNTTENSANTEDVVKNVQPSPQNAKEAIGDKGPKSGPQSSSMPPSGFGRVSAPTASATSAQVGTRALATAATTDGAAAGGAAADGAAAGGAAAGGAAAGGAAALLGPLAAVSAVAVAAAVGIKLLGDAAKSQADRLAKFSPEIQIQRAQTDVRRQLRDFERAQLRGGTLSNIQESKDRTVESLERMANKFLDPIIDDFAVLLDRISKITEAAEAYLLDEKTVALLSTMKEVAEWGAALTNPGGLVKKVIGLLFDVANNTDPKKNGQVKDPMDEMFENAFGNKNNLQMLRDVEQAFLPKLKELDEEPVK